jgi:uncharacterized membrane protein YdjX (TVP38/TMEM64 family)
MGDAENSTETPAPAVDRAIWKRLLVLAVLVAMAGTLFVAFGDELSFGKLAQRETALRQYQETHPVLVLGIAFLFYVLVTGLSLPGATVLSLSYAWFFGFWPAMILVSFASTAGATVAFIMSRHLFRDVINHRFGKQLELFNKALDEEGAFYLFSLRLIPIVPFFVINAVMGLTRLKVGTFWWVSQIGMLPGTVAYVYAGSTVPNLQTLADKGARAVPPQLYLAFVILGLLPIALKKLVGLMRPSDKS